jgi:hypothetical protein
MITVIIFATNHITLNMERILIVVAFVVWFFLTQILSGLMGNIISLPFVALRLRGGLVDFVVSVITSIIILYLGIKAFAIFGHDKLLIGVPIVMIISYAVSLGYEKDGQDRSAIRYGSFTGVILGTFLFNLI